MRRLIIKLLSIVSSITVLLITFELGSALIGECRLFYDQYLDTEFAKEFTFEKFEQIKTGMSKDEVIELIGTPLRISNYNETELMYTQDGYFYKSGRTPLNGHLDFAWLRIGVKLDSTNHVIKTSQVWYYD